MTILLHAIAAVLWVFALMFAGAVTLRAEREDNDAVMVGSVIVIILAVIAFTLQVMA